MSKKNFEFKVGDIVEFEFDGSMRVGMIDEIDSRLNTHILVYSKGMDGHNASSSSKGRRNTMEYWWFSPKELRLKNNETIIIYRKGQEVIALDKTTGKKAVAKCSPDDEFDFNIGSKLAFERLLAKEEKPEFLEAFEEGKIYVFRKELLKKRGFSISYDWVGKCDGKLVDFKCRDTGMIDLYSISPSWCEEIGYVKEK